MLFNLESDRMYESEMIKVKSRGINDMFVAKNSKRFFYTIENMSTTYTAHIGTR